MTLEITSYWIWLSLTITSFRGSRQWTLRPFVERREAGSGEPCGRHSSPINSDFQEAGPARHTVRIYQYTSRYNFLGPAWFALIIIYVSSNRVRRVKLSFGLNCLNVKVGTRISSLCILIGHVGIGRKFTWMKLYEFFWGVYMNLQFKGFYQQEVKIVRPLEVSHQFVAIIIAASHRVPWLMVKYGKCHQ